MTSKVKYKTKIWQGRVVRKNKKARMSGTRLRELKKKWFKRYGTEHDCWICGGKLEFDKITLDHVLPYSIYPEYGEQLSNLKPAHKYCNEKRGNLR